jgi:hypothetical protein
VPVVALGSYTTRKRARVQGFRGLRALGWTGYTGALSNGAVQWYQVFANSRPSLGFTVGLGALSLFAFLPHAFEAFAVSRGARVKGLGALRPTADGFVVRF